jgi:hypothetical protein
MGGRPSYVRELEHGWPWTFLRRALGYSAQKNDLLWRPPPSSFTSAPTWALFADTPLGGAEIAGYEISWTAPIAWLLADNDLYEFSWPALVADLAVGVAIVMGLTFAATRWVRSRGSVLRWRIVDMVAIITSVALVLGYWNWAKIAQDRDAKSLQMGVPQDSLTRALYWEYRGPVWLARLVGNRSMLAFCDRCVRLVGSSNGGSPADWAKIGQLTALEDLELAWPAPSETEFSHLVNLKNLRTLSWRAPSIEVLNQLPRVAQLEKIVLFSCDLSDAAITELRHRMPTVEITVSKFP